MHTNNEKKLTLDERLVNFRKHSEFLNNGGQSRHQDAAKQMEIFNILEKNEILNQETFDVIVSHVSLDDLYSGIMTLLMDCRLNHLFFNIISKQKNPDHSALLIELINAAGFLEAVEDRIAKHSDHSVLYPHVKRLEANGILTQENFDAMMDVLHTECFVEALTYLQFFNLLTPENRQKLIDSSELIEKISAQLRKYWIEEKEFTQNDLNKLYLRIENEAFVGKFNDLRDYYLQSIRHHYKCLLSETYRNSQEFSKTTQKMIPDLELLQNFYSACEELEIQKILTQENFEAMIGISDPENFARALGYLKAFNLLTPRNRKMLLNSSPQNRIKISEELYQCWFNTLKQFTQTDFEKLCEHDPHVKEKNPRELLKRLRDGDYFHPGGLESLRLTYTELLTLNVPKFDSILELGCGKGGNLDFFKKYLDLSQAIGIDIDRKSIEYAQMKYPDILFGVCDVEQIEMENQKFNLYLFFSVLYAIDTSLLGQIFLKLASISHEGAILVINDYILERNDSPPIKDFANKPMTPPSMQDLKRSLTQSGWKIIKSMSLSKMYADWYLEFLNKITLKEKVLLEDFEEETINTVKEKFTQIRNNIIDENWTGELIFAQLNKQTIFQKNSIETLAYEKVQGCFSPQKY